MMNPQNYNPMGYHSNNPPYRKTMDKTMPPPPPMLRTVTVKQVAGYPMKKKNPIMLKTVSLKDSVSTNIIQPNQNINTVSLRMI